MSTVQTTILLTDDTRIQVTQYSFGKAMVNLDGALMLVTSNDQVQELAQMVDQLAKLIL